MPRPYVTVVSGLPRSATSMMMRMLGAGGAPVLVDGLRAADDDNPRGYCEFVRVKDVPDEHFCNNRLVRRDITKVLVSRRESQ